MFSTHQQMFNTKTLLFVFHTINYLRVGVTSVFNFFPWNGNWWLKDLVFEEIFMSTIKVDTRFGSESHTDKSPIVKLFIFRNPRSFLILILIKLKFYEGPALLFICCGNSGSVREWNERTEINNHTLIILFVN